MKGTVVILGTTLLAGLIASTESPTPTSSSKPDLAPAVELRSRLDSLTKENELSGLLLVAKNGVSISSTTTGVADNGSKALVHLDTKFDLRLMNLDPPTLMPIGKDLRERVPAN